jgi:opine dehydrogenase
MTVAVLGAGAGGLSAVVELSLAGHDVLSNAEVLVICLPSVVHNKLFNDLAALGCTAPVVLNPGHTGGALHFREVFAQSQVALPPVAEFSTLTYVARINSQGVVDTTNRARQVRAACLPKGESALEWGEKLFPGASKVSDVLASSLSNVNLVLHPPGAILGASWVEATSGNFTFYVQGMTPGVGRIMQALDDERRTVAAAFGHALPSLIEEMKSIGTVESDVALSGDLLAAIKGGTANSKIAAPDSFSHRYYQEDLAYGLMPFVEFAHLAEVPVPVATSLLQIGGTAVGGQFLTHGLNSRRLGLEKLDLPSFLTSVRNQ